MLANFYYRTLSSSGRDIHIDVPGIHYLPCSPAGGANDTRRGSFSTTSRASTRTLKSYPMTASVVRILEGDFHFCFGILPPTCSRTATSPALLGLRLGSHTAKKSFKEIAESTAAKDVADIVELDVGPRPARRWSELRSVLPVCTELIVAFALRGIGEDFVSFVKFFEFVLCDPIAGIDVRVVFSCKLSIGLSDLVVGGVTLNTEYFVVILKLNRHSVLLEISPNMKHHQHKI